MMSAPPAAAAILAQMPTVFSLADLKQRMADEAHRAMDWLLEWLDGGLVQQVAPPRPVFLRADGEPLTDQDLCQALLRAFPSVVIVGGSALWRQQASSQQDMYLDCCVHERERDCILPDVRLHWRPEAWWDALRQSGGVAGSHHGIPLLSVEQALADATTFTDVWMPDQDAIDWQGFSSSRLLEVKNRLKPLVTPQRQTEI